MSLVVTSASSPLGRAVAEALVRGKPARALVLVDPEPQRITGELRTGAEVRHGDFKDVMSLCAAFAGVEAILLPGAAQATSTPGLLNALEAARTAGVERLVLLSSINPEPGNPGPWAEADRTAEAAVRSTGMGWSILRLQESLEDLVTAARRQGPGRMFDNRATGRSAPISGTDAAAAIAAVLADGSRGGRVINLTGPRLVGAADVAEAVGRRYTAHKDHSYLEQLRGDGLSAIEAAKAVALGQAVRAGYYALVTPDAQELTGRPLRDLKLVAGGA